LPQSRLDDGSRLIFPIGDAYWNSFLWENDFDYEPEVRHLLQALHATDYIFIDAGANIGYWSVLVTSAMLGRKRAVAIEASPETFAFLKLNSAANARRLVVRQNAIFDTDGIKLSFTRGPHEARHIAYNSGRGVDATISLTIDTIAGDVSPDPKQKVVVKLDVEGSEVRALSGCRGPRP
jgi:FkbM family methyltransferase